MMILFVPLTSQWIMLRPGVVFQKSRIMGGCKAQIKVWEVIYVNKRYRPLADRNILLSIVIVASSMFCHSTVTRMNNRHTRKRGSFSQAVGLLLNISRRATEGERERAVGRLFCPVGRRWTGILNPPDRISTTQRTMDNGKQNATGRDTLVHWPAT